MRNKVILSIIAACMTISISPISAEEGIRDPDALNYWEFTFGYASWSDLGLVEPAPVDFVAEESGRFKDHAPGIEIAYHRLRAEHGNALFLIGGELSGYGFSNEETYTFRNAFTGDPASIRMEASWGQVTGSVRWVWREGRKIELLAGGGAGLYILRFNDLIDDFGVVDRGEADTTIGGYLAAGVRIPLRSGSTAFRLDLRVHSFRFSGIGGAFEGQEISGPLTMFHFGMDF
jgi:hypothetical protein